MIALRNVAKAYGADPVLRDVSFTVIKGEVVCLLGPSGSGKSTLLRCINGLERYDAGEIAIDGQVVDARTLPTIRRRVGMVFQRFNLFPHRTVIGNLIEAPVRVLGRSEVEARREAMMLLERVGMAERAAAYPAALSGGQQQRVGIARALAMRPEAILFDEPTSALDPERVGEILRVIRDLARDGMTMIVATHEIAFARDVADRAVFMDGGIVVEQGPARAMLADPQTARARLFLDRVLNPL